MLGQVLNTVEYYKKKVSIPTRPIKELKKEEMSPRTITLCIIYNGLWHSNIVILAQYIHKDSSQENFLYPDEAYQERIPALSAKWNDLQVTLTLFLKYICLIF